MILPLAAAFAQDVVGKWKLDDGSAILKCTKAEIHTTERHTTAR